MLLLLSTRELQRDARRSHPRRPLHRIHARLMRLLLQDLDRRKRFERQRRCQTTQRATNGDERPSWTINDSRAQSLHPNRGRVRWSMYRRSLGSSRLLGRYWLRYWYSIGCHYYLSVLWDFSQGTEWNGKLEYFVLLKKINILKIIKKLNLHFFEIIYIYNWTLSFFHDPFSFY